jgi:hypothetical protein
MDALNPKAEVVRESWRGVSSLSGPAYVAAVQGKPSTTLATTQAAIRIHG